jgi:hypothetical protein
MPTYDTQSVINSAWGERLSYVRGGTGTTHTVTGGRHLQGTAEGLTSFGVYLIQKERITLASDALPFDPRPRDTVAPTGKPARTVISVGGSPFLKFWTLDVQYPALVDDLDALATVYRPSPTPTDEGFRNPGLTAVYTNYAVRLQPDTRTREWDTAGKVTTRSKFVCVFGTAVTLNAGDVVEVSSVRYEVTEQSEVESLGLLTFAAVERIS